MCVTLWIWELELGRGAIYVQCWEIIYMVFGYCVVGDVLDDGDCW